MRSYYKYLAGFSTGLALLIAVPLIAQEESSEQPSLNAFEAGTSISAGQVNENFEMLKAENTDLKARLEALELFVADLQAHMEVTTDAQGNPAIIISGANLHVNNGVGYTASINGTGNLIIGYDEPATDNHDPICSMGVYTNESDCQGAGGLWAISHKSGSHNLVIGQQHNYSNNSGLVAGFHNTINAHAASVTGGLGNVASADGAAVSGGQGNTASAYDASVSGGANNTASGRAASVSGGEGNTADETSASVTGGWNNTASGRSASVAGGRDNTAEGDYSTIGGGNGCEVLANDGWVAGC